MGNAINFVSCYIGKSIITDFCVVCLAPYIRLLLGLSYNSVAALLFYFKLCRSVKNKLLFIKFLFFHIYVYDGTITRSITVLLFILKPGKQARGLVGQVVGIRFELHSLSTLHCCMRSLSCCVYLLPSQLDILRRRIENEDN